MRIRTLEQRQLVPALATAPLTPFEPTRDFSQPRDPDLPVSILASFGGEGEASVVIPREIDGEWVRCWHVAGPEVVDFLLSAVKGLEPRDQVEAMHAAQMATVHLAMMRMAARFMAAETPQARESAERSLNRLARTFAAQTEALKRYRTGGEQKVTVQHQHVTVNEGGQAVVGNVSHGGRGEEKE